MCGVLLFSRLLHPDVELIADEEVALLVHRDSLRSTKLTVAAAVGTSVGSTAGVLEGAAVGSAAVGVGVEPQPAANCSRSETSAEVRHFLLRWHLTWLVGRCGRG